MRISLLSEAVLLTMLAFAGCGGTEDASDAGPDKAAIQSAMNAFIQGRIAAKTDTYDLHGVRSRFDYIHSGVKEKDGLYVSCVDFKAGDDIYDVDYYVKAENGAYTVVKELLHKKNGEVVEQVLWEK